MLAEMLVDISEQLLQVGRERSAAAADPRGGAAGAGRVARRLRAAPQAADRACRTATGPRCRTTPASGCAACSAGTSSCGPTGSARCTTTSTPRRARAMAHATFGLINSTPHSAMLPEPEMASMLEGMALRALRSAPRPDLGWRAWRSRPSRTSASTPPTPSGSAPSGPARSASSCGPPARTPTATTCWSGPTPEHTVWVNQVPEPKTVKHRIHLDLNVGSVDELDPARRDRGRRGHLPLDADGRPGGRRAVRVRARGRDQAAALRDRGRQRRLRRGMPPDRRLVGRGARRPARRRRPRLLLRRGRAGAPYELDRLRAGAGAEDRARTGSTSTCSPRTSTPWWPPARPCCGPRTTRSAGRCWPTRTATSSARSCPTTDARRTSQPSP